MDRPTIKYNQKKEKAEIKAKWWDEADGEKHSHIFGVVHKIKEAQSYRTLSNLRYARLYSNMEILGLQAGLFSRVNDFQNFLTNRVTLNVIKSCVDTAASKIAKNKPRPLFMTDGGNWNYQRRAELLTKYMEGLFEQMGTGTGDARTIYGIGRRVFVDACVFGSGAAKIFIDPVEKNVKAERILIEEIVVDDTEGIYESPRQMFQEKLVFRDVLLDMYKDSPDLVFKIQSATSGISDGYRDKSSADMIKVIEAWHLPSGGDATDGRKVICIENATLSDVEWDKPYFPFVFQRWNPRILGFYGQGLAEELVGIQLEINKLLRNIQIAQHLMAVPQVWLELQNKVAAKKINNEIGGIKYYSGQPPIFMVPTAMNPEIYQHLDRLEQKAYNITGISALSAQSKKPSGLDSGVALREYQDIESERFILAGLRYEDFFMDVTYMALDMLDDLASKEGVNPAVRIQQGNWDRLLKWGDVKLPKDQYTLRAFPTALLPSTPVGKLQTVQEMVQAGFFEKDEALDLLNFPDIESVVSLKLSGRKDIMMMIDKMVEDGTYQPPEPFINASLAASLSQSYYNRGRVQGMPEDKLELLRRFMDDCRALVEQSQMAAQAPVDPNQAIVAAGAQADGTDQAIQPGQPAQAPVSDLLPVGA